MVRQQPSVALLQKIAIKMLPVSCLFIIRRLFNCEFHTLAMSYQNREGRQGAMYWPVSTVPYARNKLKKHQLKHSEKIIRLHVEIRNRDPSSTKQINSLVGSWVTQLLATVYITDTSTSKMKSRTRSESDKCITGLSPHIPNYIH
jgi:hypothetical protein